MREDDREKRRKQLLESSRQNMRQSGILVSSRRQKDRAVVQSRRLRRIKRRFRLAVKLFLMLGGCFLLLYLLGRTVLQITAPAAEKENIYISRQEAGNLVWLLADTAARAEQEAGSDGQSREQEQAAGKTTDASAAEPVSIAENTAMAAAAEAIEEKISDFSNDKAAALTYQEAQALTALLPDCPARLPDGYGKKEKIEREDWYQWFDQVRGYFDPTGLIRDTWLTILGTGDEVHTNDGLALAANELLSTEKKYRFHAPVFGRGELLRRQIKAVTRQDSLYALREEAAEDGFSLPNVWVIHADEKEALFFWNDHEIKLQAADMALLANGQAKDGQEAAEFVADLLFTDGRLTGMTKKSHKVSGRLLRVADGGAEIEGQGFFPFSEQLKIYQLYGRMKRLYTSDLSIGYAFTDFIIEDGRIEAALVQKEALMENIRVLVKTSDYGGPLHEQIVLSADCDCTIVSGAYGNTRGTRLAAGEKLTLTKDSSLFAHGDRVWVKPDILTGRIRLENVNRSQGAPSYRGSFEFMKNDGGIAAINEVLLEEYLYAVVPSEMPASYPLEALKSQAVCARTYAYRKMRQAGLPAYGAHVDDSAGFQVYQNIGEQPETTRAVKETKGQVLFFEQDIAETYYYSTSCGFGTDATIWLNGNADQYPYLMAQAIDTNTMETTLAFLGEVNGDKPAGDMIAAMAPVADQARLLQEEALFAAFLADMPKSDYEQAEPWYRWTYQVERLDEEQLNRAIRKRYQASPAGVLTRQKDGSFVSVEPPHTGKVKEIAVVSRGAGGVAQELLVTGEQASILVKTEHNIRYVLCDGQTKVTRQDGSQVNAASMLPSAFLTIRTDKENGTVCSLLIEGGGFGHGVGLSQNGAKNMALAGKDCGEILSFFYKGCQKRDIYARP